MDGDFEVCLELGGGGRITVGRASLAADFSFMVLWVVL